MEAATLGPLQGYELMLHWTVFNLAWVVTVLVNIITSINGQWITADTFRKEKQHLTIMFRFCDSTWSRVVAWIISTWIRHCEKYKKMQLDVDMSPPANIMTLNLDPCDHLYDLQQYLPQMRWETTFMIRWPWPLGWPWPSWPLTLTNVTFDLDPRPSLLPGSLSNEASNYVF